MGVKFTNRCHPPLGNNHPNTAIILDNLATFYHDQRRYKEAEPLYLEALEISKKILGNNHPNTIAIKEDYKLLMNYQNLKNHQKPK